MTGLPDSLKRAGAQRVTDRESALLDNLETVRRVEAGVPPDLKDDLIAWLGSCQRSGLETKESISNGSRSIHTVDLDGITVAHLWVEEDDEGHRVTMSPTDLSGRGRR